MADENNLLYERDMDGESLVKDVLNNGRDCVDIVDDETHEIYYWNTIDRSKKYHVIRVTEYFRLAWDYSKITYHIKEIK